MVQDWGSLWDQEADAVMLTALVPSPAVLYVNAAFHRMTGFPADAVLGKPPLLLHGPDTSRAMLLRLQEDLAADRPFRGVMLSYRRDGGSFWADLSIRPLLLNAPERKAFLTIWRDVTPLPLDCDPEPPCVLVVDDDLAVRTHAVRLVLGLGYGVRPASSGPEALRLLTENPRCHALFTDVRMPGMSGGQLALAARQMVPDLPVIFATGFSDDPVVEQLRAAGLAVVLHKPYRRRAVADALRQALETWPGG